MRIRSLVLSALLATTAPSVIADPVAQAQDKLDRYYQAFENRTAELEDVENELFGYQNKLKDAQADLAAAQEELVKAQKEQASAKIQLAGDASQDNERALKLADHALKMAERGVRTRTKREERVQSNLAELMAEKTRLASQITADEARIGKQEALVADTKRKLEQQNKALLAAAERAKEEAQQRQAQAKEKAEADRIAAAEAEKRAQEAAIAAAEKARAEVAQQVIAEEKVEMSELDKEALAYAQKEVARLENLLAKGNPGRPTFKRLTLGGNKIDSKPFEFLGQNQYRVESVVVNGRQIFQIGKHKFRRTIPAADNGAEYVFIFDAKRPSRPRLVMYKKSLLENI